MGTHEYPWVSKYMWITCIEIPAQVWGRARVPYRDTRTGMGSGTGTIFIQRGRDRYHTTCIHGYPLTSLGAFKCGFPDCEFFQWSK